MGTIDFPGSARDSNGDKTLILRPSCSLEEQIIFILPEDGGSILLRNVNTHLGVV
jgi:hypothetical protein